WMEERGVLAERRLARAAREVETIAVTALRERIGDLHGDRRLGALAERVGAGELDPYRAADELVASLTEGGAAAHGTREGRWRGLPPPALSAAPVRPGGGAAGAGQAASAR